jgi:CheY-like chemotaxis protein
MPAVILLLGVQDRMTRVLIVEDEALIAMLLEEMLADRGYVVAGHGATLAEACELARTLEVDAAILDVSLIGEEVFPVAEILLQRGIPFVFTTGYGAAGLPPSWSGHPVFTKPYDIDPLTQSIERLVQRADVHGS